MERIITVNRYSGSDLRKAHEEGRCAYDLQADAMRRQAEKENDPEAQEYFRNMSVFYDSLSAIRKTTGERQIMDTGIFNEEITAYCRLACNRAGLDYDQTDEVIYKLRALFDEYTALDAMKAAGYQVDE